MIEISAALQQDSIKDLLENLDKDGIKYTFKEKKGINLIFDVEGDAQQAAKLAKESIKATDWGKVLYFSVSSK